MDYGGFPTTQNNDNSHQNNQNQPNNGANNHERPQNQQKVVHNAPYRRTRGGVVRSQATVANFMTCLARASAVPARSYNPNSQASKKQKQTTKYHNPVQGQNLEPLVNGQFQQATSEESYQPKATGQQHHAPVVFPENTIYHPSMKMDQGLQAVPNANFYQPSMYNQQGMYNLISAASFSQPSTAQGMVNGLATYFQPNIFSPAMSSIGSLHQPQMGASDNFYYTQFKQGEAAGFAGPQSQIFIPAGSFVNSGTGVRYFFNPLSQSQPHDQAAQAGTSKDQQHPGSGVTDSESTIQPPKQNQNYIPSNNQQPIRTGVTNNQEGSPPHTESTRSATGTINDKQDSYSGVIDSQSGVQPPNQNKNFGPEVSDKQYSLSSRVTNTQEGTQPCTKSTRPASVPTINQQPLTTQVIDSQDRSTRPATVPITNQQTLSGQVIVSEESIQPRTGSTRPGISPPDDHEQPKNYQVTAAQGVVQLHSKNLVSSTGSINYQQSQVTPATACQNGTRETIRNVGFGAGYIMGSQAQLHPAIVAPGIQQFPFYARPQAVIGHQPNMGFLSQVIPTMFPSQVTTRQFPENAKLEVSQIPGLQAQVQSTMVSHSSPIQFPAYEKFSPK